MPSCEFITFFITCRGFSIKRNDVIAVFNNSILSAIIHDINKKLIYNQINQTEKFTSIFKN